MSRPHARAQATRRSSRKARNIRVVIADGQAIDRAGLVGLIENEPNFVVRGEAASVEEAIHQCRALKPDVLVLSLNIMGQDQQAAIPTIRAALPTQRILALSERGASNCVVLNPPSRARLPLTVLAPCEAGTDCLELAAVQGALGTLRRSADPEELFRAIRAVADDHAWHDPSTVSRTSAERDNGPNARGAERSQLSERELDVAALISEGLSNKEISSALKIGEPTVKKYVGRILIKLGLQDRLQAGLFVARHPLLLKRSNGTGPGARTPEPEGK